MLDIVGMKILRGIKKDEENVSEIIAAAADNVKKAIEKVADNDTTNIVPGVKGFAF